MARITVTIPNNLHEQIIKIADKESESISYTTSRLVEIGLMVLNSKSEDQKKTSDIEEYCQKLIIQINGIIKEIAVAKFDFDEDKIVQITNDTLIKFNKLKGIHSF